MKFAFKFFIFLSVFNFQLFSVDNTPLRDDVESQGTLVKLKKKPCCSVTLNKVVSILNLTCLVFLVYIAFYERSIFSQAQNDLGFCSNINQQLSNVQAGVGNDLHKVGEALNNTAQICAKAYAACSKK